MSQEHIGFALRIFSVAIMVAMSACVHEAAKYMPAGQIMFWRSGVALIAIVVYMAWCRDLPQAFYTKRPLGHVVRGGFGALTMFCSFTSLAYLPVATAQALSYFAPILTLPLAAWSLGEVISRKAVIAVVIGMAGVMTILWHALHLPGQDAWIGVLAGVGFAVCMAFMRIQTKTLTRTESAATISFYFAAMCMVAGLASWPLGWATLDNHAIWPLIGAGVLGGLGHVMGAEAVARSSVGNLAVFDYTGIIWALLFDFVLFSTVPGLLGMIGMVLILGAAMLPILPVKAKMRRA